MSKKSRFLILSGTVAPFVMAAPLLSIGCNNKKSNYMYNTQGYSDLITKLANKTITVGAGWGDCRLYAGAEAKNIVAIGATTTIANDGIQVRPGMTAEDIQAIQQLFIQTDKKAYETKIDPATNKPKYVNNDLLIDVDGKGKMKPLFSVYNHEAYSAVNPTSEIIYDTDGAKKVAYGSQPSTSAAQYLKYDASLNKISKVSGSKDLKIRFIPSTDPTQAVNATTKLQAYFATMGLDNIKISVASNSELAGESLNNGTIDVAFLPVNNWATTAPKSMFILQAGRPVQIVDPYLNGDHSNPALKATGAQDYEKDLVTAMNNYSQFNSLAGKKALFLEAKKSERPKHAIANVYPQSVFDANDAISEPPVGQSLGTVGYYRSWIFARSDSKIAELVLNALNTQGSNWKLKWDDVKQYVKVGYNSTTSTASFVYPEAWFKKHFEGFTKFEI